MWLLGSITRKEELIIVLAFFPAEYEYSSHFLPARPDFPKVYVKGVKIILNDCFYFVLMVKITNSFNVLHD